MYYANYNDYELLYLISEGSEQALNLLYKKYYIYINKIVSKLNIAKYKKEDMVQEGVIIFFKSIKKYNPVKYNKTFYNYFKFILERHIYKTLKSSNYYSTSISLTENLIKDEVYSPSNKISMYRSMLEDELEKDIFDKCLVEGLSLRVFAEMKGLTYKQIYYKVKCICERLKKY